MTPILIVAGLVIFIGVPFTLWWWRLADKWADAEHKRFKVKVDPRERIVVKLPGPAGEQQGGPKP